jgi:hypothetical protein
MNMDDDKVRDLLQRYRPVGPPSNLRAVALRASSRERIWPWVAAAAVLLTATVAIHFETTRAIGRLAPPPVDPTRGLAAAMGGDQEAERAATSIIQERAFRDFLSGPSLDRQTIEGELNSAN